MSSRRRQIAALLQSGLSVSQIAHRLDLAPATVRYHLTRLDAPSPAAPDGRCAAQTARVDPTTRDRVQALLGQGVARSEIARRLGVSKGTVSYHARRLGETVDERCARRYDWAAIQSFYDDGHSMRTCAERFGFSTASWFAAVQRGAVAPRPTRLSIAELCIDGTPRGREYLKLRLLREGVKTARCEVCGLHEWQGASLSLALHHINGRRTDNRLENLQLLCPNCHSQTDNFAGRRRSGDALGGEEAAG